MTTEIEKNKKDKLYTMLIITDIEKAFDNVNIDTLKKELTKIKINEKYTNMILQYLSDREIILKTANKE